MNEQWEKLGKLQDYFAKYKSLPSYSYMSEVLKFGAKNSIFIFVNKLKNEQFLDIAPDNKLVPGKRFFERRMSLSSVQAGEFYDDHVEEYDMLNLDELLVKQPSITELMPVEGQSMIDERIYDGDIAVIEVRKDVNVGQIIVAKLADGKKTIKKLGMENGKHVLIPANKDFETLRPKEGFEIYGLLKKTIKEHN